MRISKIKPEIKSGIISQVEALEKANGEEITKSVINHYFKNKKELKKTRERIAELKAEVVELENSL